MEKPFVSMELLRFTEYAGDVLFRLSHNTRYCGVCLSVVLFGNILRLLFALKVVRYGRTRNHTELYILLSA